MLWSKRNKLIDEEREKLGMLKDDDVEEALMQLNAEPLHSYLLRLVDELVRQGIYLSREEQEGAKLFIKIIGGELQKARELVEKKDKIKRRVEKNKLP